MDSHASADDVTHQRVDSAWKIVGLYAVFAGLWIWLSDRLLMGLFGDVESLAQASSWKGYAFILVTSAMLFVLISRLIGNFQQALRIVKQREHELIDSRRLLLESQKTAGLGTYELDIASGTWTSSEVCNQVLGIDIHFVRSIETWKSFIHPSDRDWLVRFLTEAIAGPPAPFSLEYRIVRPLDGSERWIRALGDVEHDSQGHAAKIRGTLQDISEYKRAQERITEANNKLTATLDALPDLLFEIGEDGYIHQYHSHRDDLLAAPPEVFLGKRVADILPPSATAVLDAAVREASDHGFSSGRRYALEIPTGLHWFDLSVAPMAPGTDGSRRFICIARDITERFEAERKLELAGLVFQHSREGIMITSADARIVDVNDAFSHVTGYSRSEVIGKNPSFLSSGRQTREFYGAMWAKLNESGYWDGEVWNRRKDGSEYAELLTISSVRDAQGQVAQYVALFSDITPLKEYQFELEHLAHFDALTGLPNRLLLADRLEQSMAQSERRGKKVVVAYFDLDSFKSINDHSGHAVGDQLLVALGHRIKGYLREEDTFARMGGDEFVAVLADFDSVDAVIPLVKRIIEATAQPFELEGVTIQTSTSIGISLYPQDSPLDAEQLLRQADQAMYQAKLAGKNRFHIFDTQHDTHVREQHGASERLRQALNHGELVLHYQPKVNMRTGQVIGAEALIRWNHPELGLQAPGTFLPSIEGSLLSIDVGEWVVETALQQHERWLDAGLQIPVSVNIGALQLQQADFVCRLQAILARHPRVAPTHVQLEILETSALQDMSKATDTINECKALGIEFALDDFGTGYSSLTYLRQLPVSVLKIDQSFVRGMLDNAADQAILRGVIGLAKAFGRSIIAEGVETVAHGTLLLHMGCDEGQGYGIARPMPGEQLVAWHQAWRPDPDWCERTA